MGTQKNRLDETVLLGTQNICEKVWVRKYLQFYTQKLCLSKPMEYHQCSYLKIGSDVHIFCSLELQIFSCPSVLSFVLGAQKNRLIETILFSTHNIYFG